MGPLWQAHSQWGSEKGGNGKGFMVKFGFLCSLLLLLLYRNTVPVGLWLPSWYLFTSGQAWKLEHQLGSRLTWWGKKGRDGGPQTWMHIKTPVISQIRICQWGPSILIFLKLPSWLQCTDKLGKPPKGSVFLCRASLVVFLGGYACFLWFFIYVSVVKNLRILLIELLLKLDFCLIVETWQGVLILHRLPVGFAVVSDTVKVTPVEQGFLFGVIKCSGTRSWWWSCSSVNALSVTSG